MLLELTLTMLAFGVMDLSHLETGLPTSQVPTRTHLGTPSSNSDGIPSSLIPMLPSLKLNHLSVSRSCVPVLVATALHAPSILQRTASEASRAPIKLQEQEEPTSAL